MRRPYPDLSTPPRVGCTRRRPFRSSGWGTVEKGTVWFKPGAVSFACATMTSGDHRRKSAVHRSRSINAVDHRGRESPIWRSLRTGRRMRRPYTDLSTPPRVGCTRRRPFRSSGWGTVEKGTVWFKPGAVFPVSGVFAVNNRGRWLFTWRSLRTGRRMRRPYTDLSTPPRAWTLPIGTRFVPLRGVVIICAICGLVFAVNIRGRWWFTWRSLHPGRRMRRPYTDLSNPARVGCTRRRPFRSSGGRWKRGQFGLNHQGTVEKGKRGQFGLNHHRSLDYIGMICIICTNCTI